MGKEDFTPHEYNFYPPVMSIGPRVPLSSTYIPNANLPSGASRQGMCLLTIEPRKDPLISNDVIESFEFVTRNLFVLRTQPISKAMR